MIFYVSICLVHFSSLMLTLNRSLSACRSSLFHDAGRSHELLEGLVHLSAFSSKGLAPPECYPSVSGHHTPFRLIHANYVGLTSDDWFCAYSASFSSRATLIVRGLRDPWHFVQQPRRTSPRYLPLGSSWGYLSLPCFQEWSVFF